MREEIPIPPPTALEPIEDLSSARSMLAQLLATLATLQALVHSLQQTIELQRQELEQLRRERFGPSREHVVPIEREIGQKRKKDQTPEEREAARQRALQKREEQAQKRRDQAPEIEVIHAIVESHCTGCGASVEEAFELSDETSEEYEYVPAHLVRRIHRRRRRVCRCGCFLTAPAPPRVVEGGLYGPGLHAHVAVAKCADSIPCERLSKQFARAGVPLGRSTLGDLFHRDACLLRPLWMRLVEKIASCELVNADETPIGVQERDKCRRAYVWTFIGERMVCYVFSASRSGKTPTWVLGESEGLLQVDAYTGYNEVTRPRRRKRVGCMSHARRKFFKALEQAPEEARCALDLIRELYEVEYDALALEPYDVAAHLELRRTRSAAVMWQLWGFLTRQQGQHLPKSAMGKAVAYMLGQWEPLTRFLEDARLRLDNNLSERQLRLIALGRKNYLFVGDDQGGENLAILQSLVSTCIYNKIDPQAYLSDVLMRIGEHPHSRLDELLPMNWQPPSG
jgi:transposase